MNNESAEKENKRWEEIKEIARNNGYLVVSISPRRYMVIRQHTASAILRAAENRKIYTFMEGTVELPSATMDQCVQFISEYTQPVPEHLY